MPHANLLEATFIPGANKSLIQWLETMLPIFFGVIKHLPAIDHATMWISSTHFNEIKPKIVRQMIASHLISNWSYNIHDHNLLDYGECIAAHRVSIRLSASNVEETTHTVKNIGENSEYEMNGYGFHKHIDKANIDNRTADIIKLENYSFDTDNEIDHSIRAPRVIGIVSCGNRVTSKLTAHREQTILDPMFPATEQSDGGTGKFFFGNRVGIPLQSEDNQWHARQITLHELLRLYSIDTTPITAIPQRLEQTADALLPHCIPWSFRRNLMQNDECMNNIVESFVNGDTMQCDTSQCYFNSTPPETLNWKSAYLEDPDTNLIMSKLSDTQHVTWEDKQLANINSAYKMPLKDGRIQIVNKKLVLFKSILANQRHIMLIIVPMSLRRKMFAHYHAGPSGGHMGEYKTLYRMRLRFFWPRLREDIKEWIKKCAHCIAYNVWRN